MQQGEFKVDDRVFVWALILNMLLDEWAGAVKEQDAVHSQKYARKEEKEFLLMFLGCLLEDTRDFIVLLSVICALGQLLKTILNSEITSSERWI